MLLEEDDMIDSNADGPGEIFYLFSTFTVTGADPHDPQSPKLPSFHKTNGLASVRTHLTPPSKQILDPHLYL